MATTKKHFVTQEQLFEELHNEFGLEYKDLIGTYTSAATANRMFKGGAVGLFHFVEALVSVRDTFRACERGNEFDAFIICYLNALLDEFRRCHG